MSNSKIITGLDIGSSQIRTVIVEDSSEEDILKIVGIGQSPSLGVRRGAVVDIEEAAMSIRASIDQAEKMAGNKVKSVILGVKNLGIEIQNSKGVVAVGKADGEVTQDDINRSIEAAQAISIPPNREIIHIIPKNYRLDDQVNIKDPLGMKGVRLEVDAMIIEGQANHLDNIAKSAYQTGVEVDDVVLGPLAVAEAVLDKRQKELGVAVIDIGAGTTSLAVFEEDELIYTGVIPVGAGHITNDIAIGLRTSIETAEKVKLEYGSSFSRDVSKKDEIDLSRIDSKENDLIYRRHTVEIIEARLDEIFELINKELKIIGKAGLLPAGVVLVGGGANLPQIVDFAKEKLGLPAQIGFPKSLGGVLNKVDDPSFATVIGLTLWAREHENYDKIGWKFFSNINTSAIFGKVKRWLDNFMP